MANDDLEDLLRRLGRNEDASYAAIAELRNRLGPRLLDVFLERFDRTRTWKERVGMIFFSMFHARASEAAFQLGLKAIRDRSRFVRYRGSELLAVAQRKEALPELERALLKLGRAPGHEDLLAAIDAIRSENHNYFVDRSHSGKITLNVPQQGEMDGGNAD